MLVKGATGNKPLSDPMSDLCDNMAPLWHNELTHWGRVTHICVGNLTIIGSDIGLSPDRHQAIIWTNAAILLIGPLGTWFSEILIGILTFSFKKVRLKMSSGKWWPFCLGLNVSKIYSNQYRDKWCRYQSQLHYETYILYQTSPRF